MNRKYVDFSGQQVGYLTIIQRTDTPENQRSGVVYWLARCVCGKEKITTSWAIRQRGDRLSCGCKRYYHGQPKNRKHEDPKDATWNSIINSYKQRCKRDRIQWQLTRQQAITLFQDKCQYCGIEPFVIRNIYQTKQRLQHESSDAQEWRDAATVRYNGIDRIDSTGDYTKDNVTTCCKICNYAKRDLTIDEFKQWLERIKHG